MLVDTMYGGYDGRLFHFEGTSGTNDANGPLRESVIITYSSFQRLYQETDGTFARVNLRKMQLRIEGVHPSELITFRTVFARYAAVSATYPTGVYGSSGLVGFGGVLYIENLY